MVRSTWSIRKMALCGIWLLSWVLASPAWACDVTLKPDGNTAAIQHGMDRISRRPTVICLRPGVYTGARLVATRSCVLRRLGAGKVVLDAGAQGRVLTVPQAGIDVTLEGITLTNGKADRGGGIALTQASKLRLQDCWIYNNMATLLGGGAISASSGELTLVRTRITGNRGDRAAALDLGGNVHARMVSSLVADNEAKGTSEPSIRLSSAAELVMLSCTVAYNSGSGIVLQPDGPGRRKLAIDSSIVMGKPDAITVQRPEVDAVRVERSILWGGIGWVALDMASKKALPGFNLKEVERYRPEKGAQSIGMGQCMDREDRLDLAGQRRGKVCTAGALEAPPADVRATLRERAKRPPKKPHTWEDL